MGLVTREAVETALRQYTDPHLNQDPVSAGCLRGGDIQGGKGSVLTDEAGLFTSLSSNYGGAGGPALDVLLSGHSGGDVRSCRRWPWKTSIVWIRPVCRSIV